MVEEKTVTETIDIPERILSFLKSPDLFDNIQKELDKSIAGETIPKKIISLILYGGRCVINVEPSAYNILVNDESGVGKDYVTRKIFENLPSYCAIKKTRISPTVLNYWHTVETEPEWSWDGKVLYLSDISENVLNSEVMKLFCSDGNSTTITERNKEGLYAKEIEIRGKPIIIGTTANSIINEETMRRWTLVPLDHTKEQTNQVMQTQAEFLIKGHTTKAGSNLKEAISCLKPYKIKCPYASEVAKAFPIDRPIYRTMFTRFIYLCFASCSLHQYQREIETDDDGNIFLICSEQDYKIAKECFEYTLDRRDIPLQIYQRKILDIMEKNPDKDYSVDEWSTLCNFISEKNLRVNMQILSSLGFVTHTFSIHQTLNRQISKFQYRPPNTFTLPEFQDLKSQK